MPTTRFPSTSAIDRTSEHCRPSPAGPHASGLRRCSVLFLGWTSDEYLGAIGR